MANRSAGIADELQKLAALRERGTLTPDEFAAYEKVAYTKGFLMVSASPLTRSSHHAGDDFAKLKAACEKRRGSSA